MITRKAATIFLVLIGLVVIPVVSAHAQKSPPSAPPPPGAVVWFDLLTEDADAVLEFYGELFGWDIQVHTPSHHVVVHNGQPIAGISQIENEDPDGGGAFWLAGIVVDDVDKAVKRATRRGAPVHVQPADSAGYARYAIISDSEGIPVMLLDPFTNLGGDHGPGSWVWAELWARNPDSAASFYEEVVGYKKGQTEVGGAPYQVFKTRDEIRAGLVKTPHEKIKPAWAPYLLVADLDDVIARTPKLGGTVLAQPDTFSSLGSVALLADPTGAAFFVYQRNEEGASK